MKLPRLSPPWGVEGKQDGIGATVIAAYGLGSHLR